MRTKLSRISIKETKFLSRDALEEKYVQSYNSLMHKLEKLEAYEAKIEMLENKVDELTKELDESDIRFGELRRAYKALKKSVEK